MDLVSVHLVVDFIEKRCKHGKCGRPCLFAVYLPIAAQKKKSIVRFLAIKRASFIAFSAINCLVSRAIESTHLLRGPDSDDIRLTS